MCLKTPKQKMATTTTTQPQKVNHWACRNVLSIADKKNLNSVIVPFFSLTAPAPPNNTLFVSNLSYNVKEKKLKNVFQKAVRINVPQSKGKPRG